MNVSLYDFDGTIYRGDSAIDYTLYSLMRRPLKILYFPVFIISGILYLLKRIEKERVKSSLFRMMVIEQKILCAFWNKKRSKLIRSVIELIEEDRIENRESIIISASPRFLLEPIVRNLSMSVLLATETDIEKPWIITGKNCYGEEKVLRFNQWKYFAATNPEVERVVSDSSSDWPLYQLGGTAMRVRSGMLEYGKP